MVTGVASRDRSAWVAAVVAATVSLAVMTVAIAQEAEGGRRPAARRAQQQQQQSAAAEERTAAGAVTPVKKAGNRHEEFLYRKGQGKIDLLFLGDSITDFWPRRGEWTWLQLAKYNPANFGVSGDRTEHLLWRITNGELDGIEPKVVVVLIGSNNVGSVPSEKPEWAAAGVRKVVDVVREKLPEARVLVLGVFPRHRPGTGQQERVRQVNAVLAGSLAGVDRVRYMDIGEKFLGPDGTPPADVMPDGVHPTAKGYGIWYREIAPVLDEMMR